MPEKKRAMRQKEVGGMATIATNKHVFVGGMTGSGKTHLIKSYLANQRVPVVKLDTKGEALDELREKKNPWIQVNPKELIVVERFDHVEDALEEGYPRIIYCPIFEELDKVIYNEFYKLLYLHRNITAWTDELLEILEHPQDMLPYLKGILTRGRSRNVSSWSASQRPVGVNPLCIGMSSHVFAFDMNPDQDREKMFKVTTAPEFLHRPGWHNFWYWEQGWQNAVKGRLDR